MCLLRVRGAVEDYGMWANVKLLDRVSYDRESAENAGLAQWRFLVTTRQPYDLT